MAKNGLDTVTLAGRVGIGTIRAIAAAAPRVAGDLVVTVPVGKIWRLITFRAVLVTDANAANRVADLIIDDGNPNVIVFQRSPVALLTASSTWGLMASADGGAASNGNNQIHIPIPANLLLAAGFRLRTATTNVQVGDQYGAAVLWVEEWDE